MVAVEGAVVQGVQALALVLLATDRAALGLVGEVAEDEPRLDEPSVLLQRAGERQLAASGLQPRDEQARGDGAVAQRRGAAHEVIPAVADHVDVQRVRQQLRGGRRAGGAEPVEAAVGQPGQARGEL